MKNLLFAALLFFSLVTSVKAQYSTLNAHSHNDYEQVIPFFLAYNSHFGSIEADIWAVDGELFVAHNQSEITPERTLDSLYLQPVVRLFRKNGGKAWADQASTFQLLIDLKTGVEPTLPLLVEKLKKYPDVFDPEVNKNAIRIVISGNRPDPVNFENFPGFIFFDGKLNLRYDVRQLERIPLFSENLKVFTNWNGERNLPEKEEQRLRQVVDSVQSLNKKIRFWNAPDSIPAWKTLMDLKVDYINTDHIQDLADFLKIGKK